MEPLPEDSATGSVGLQEPLSSEQAVLRTSLVEGLLASARRNVDAGNEEIALFEQAHVYLPSGEQRLPEEALACRWDRARRFRVREGTVEGLYAALEVEPSFRAAATCPRPVAALAPTRAGSASVAPHRPAGGWGASS